MAIQLNPNHEQGMVCRSHPGTILWSGLRCHFQWSLCEPNERSLGGTWFRGHFQVAFLCSPWLRGNSKCHFVCHLEGPWVAPGMAPGLRGHFQGPFCVDPGWTLGGPWMAPGWPLGGPWWPLVAPGRPWWTLGGPWMPPGWPLGF